MGVGGSGLWAPEKNENAMRMQIFFFLGMIGYDQDVMLMHPCIS